MSLVQLANVCSHLQNASLARLALTSIPYTKLHLSLALLLQKQGFISHLKLGGPSPPASVFAQGPRDHHHVTNHPRGAAGRNRCSPEAALALVVRKRSTPRQLRSLGFPEESIAFAQKHGRRTLEDAAQIPRFIADINARVRALAEARETDFQRQYDELVAVPDHDPRRRKELEKIYGENKDMRRERAEKIVIAPFADGQRAIYRRYKGLPSSELEATSYDLKTLNDFAGNGPFVTERELRLNGITVEAMGLAVSNQSITLPPLTAYQDPDQLETEGIVTQANRASRRLWLGLKYFESKPVLSKARMISMPTKRIWLNGRDIGRLVRGSQAGEVKPLTRVGEIMAINTDRGIMEARECVERMVGGQPLCRVW